MREQYIVSCTLGIVPIKTTAESEENAEVRISEVSPISMVVQALVLPLWWLQQTHTQHVRYRVKRYTSQYVTHVIPTHALKLLANIED